jgi:glycerol-3-phosphate dehydrogenase
VQIDVTAAGPDLEVAVVGAGVVGAATALELSRRGASVALLEGEDEPGLQASGTNSGVLHTGFDSVPGELETDLILRAAKFRDPLLEALAIPVLRCGARMRPLAAGERAAIEALAENAARNGVEARLAADGSLAIPGESVTDPVAFTLSLVRAAVALGAELRTGFRVAAMDRAGEGLEVRDEGGARVRCRAVVNCAGLGAGEVARLVGDESFDVYPRKGEFLVFDPPGGKGLEEILLPVPTKRTKGVLVFPTVDGKVVAGPTAVDLERPDWSVRPQAAGEILPKAVEMHPPLADAEPAFAYAGLRPAGRGANYVIARSRAEPALINVAAIRSTGLTAAPAIGERAAELVADAGVSVGDAEPLTAGAAPAIEGPWWRRTADRVAA